MTPPKPKERLTDTAIQREGEVKSGFRSHYQLRLSLDPTANDHRRGRPGDVDGFITSTGRFVTRKEARLIALECGQVSHHWKNATRDLLSSDILW